METVDKAAGRICVRDVTLSEVEPFDLGGNGRMDGIIQKAGYRKTENGDAYRSIARTSVLKVFLPSGFRI